MERAERGWDNGEHKKPGKFSSFVKNMRSSEGRTWRERLLDALFNEAIERPDRIHTPYTGSEIDKPKQLNDPERSVPFRLEGEASTIAQQTANWLSGKVTLSDEDLTTQTRRHRQVRQAVLMAAWLQETAPQKDQLEDQDPAIVQPMDMVLEPGDVEPTWPEPMDQADSWVDKKLAGWALHLLANRELAEDAKSILEERTGARDLTNTFPAVVCPTDEELRASTTLRDLEVTGALADPHRESLDIALGRKVYEAEIDGTAIDVNQAGRDLVSGAEERLRNEARFEAYLRERPGPMIGGASSIDTSPSEQNGPQTDTDSVLGGGFDTQQPEGQLRPPWERDDLQTPPPGKAL